jgi:hypothetical protein
LLPRRVSMEITVARLWKNEVAITGTFSVDGVQKYFSLELPELFDGLPNIPDKTCILPGTYPVERLMSVHWNMMMPHVTHVPGRTEIEIHIANFPKDILGCMGIGMTRLSDTEIGESRVAFNDFNLDFENALRYGEEVTITIS